MHNKADSSLLGELRPQFAEDHHVMRKTHRAVLTTSVDRHGLGMNLLMGDPVLSKKEDQKKPLQIDKTMRKTILAFNQDPSRCIFYLPSPESVVQGFPLGDIVVDMLSLTPGGLEPTVTP